MRTSSFFTALAVLSAVILCCGCSASFQAGLVRTYAHTRALTMAGYEKAMADSTDKGTAPVPVNVRFPREVTESRFEGMQVFRMDPEDDSKPLLLYIHGGAYCKSFDKNHWKSLADIARQTGCGLVAPNYPLLPLHTALDAHRLSWTFTRIWLGRSPLTASLWRETVPEAGLPSPSRRKSEMLDCRCRGA